MTFFFFLKINIRVGLTSMIGFKKMLNITKENEKRLKFDVTETGLNDRSEAEKKAEGSGPL